MAMNNENVLLRMEGITKQFPGVKALDGVNLTVRAGTVHALMGENGAGKSTLMKCLFGVYQKNSGKIFLEGKEVSFKNSKEALENGVAMVHQELNQALSRNVMDNMWLGRFPKTGPFTSEKKMYDATMEVFEELGVKVNPKTIMSSMPVSQRQMVEIAKAVSYKSKIIVFDEPTSSLTETEVDHLFEIINMLRDRGCGIIYISHKMAEIKRISDEITIMRDGKWIATEKASDLEMNDIIRLMVGRDVFSTDEAIIFFGGAGSWKTEKGTYSSRNGKFTPAEGVEVEDGYVKRINTIVRNKISYCKDVAKYDYFNYVSEALKELEG